MAGRPRVEKKKRELSQRERFTSFRNNHCPYCGAADATLKPYSRGFHGHCTSSKCKADNFFTNKKAKEWYKE